MGRHSEKGRQEGLGDETGRPPGPSALRQQTGNPGFRAQGEEDKLQQSEVEIPACRPGWAETAPHPRARHRAQRPQADGSRGGASPVLLMGALGQGCSE